jgi:nucleotide-binding universal stress UspA family protein
MLTLAAVTTNALNITFAGVVIAILFLASIVSVLGWMFRLPKETERTRTVARATRSVNKLTRILVPLLSKSEATDRIVALAAQMVRSRNGNVELLVVLEVPFTLPLDARVEDDEKDALEILDRAESVTKQSVTAVNKRIVKARNAGSAIVHEAETQAVDLVLMANTPIRVRGNVQHIHPAVDYVMKNAPCEVLVLSQGHPDVIYNGVGASDMERKATTAGITR